MLHSQHKSQIVLVDFGSEAPPRLLSYADRVVYDRVCVSRCIFQANPGTEIGATQFTIAIHEGAPSEMEWCVPETGKVERRRMVAGDIQINACDRPIFQRWTGSLRSLVIAIEQDLIKQVANEFFEGKEPALRTMIGIRDPVIEGMAAAWRRELAERGAGGRLYMEGLASALAVHIFRAYGDGVGRSAMVGGLGALRLRRTVDYIEAHLAEEISLRDLAALTNLSRHHFSEAFKASTGTSPHRYLIERRICRAKELLLGGEKSIAEIAIEVGFASHSHFTDYFRKITGTTPSRFRADRS